MKTYITCQILAGWTESPSEAVYLSLVKLGNLTNNFCGLEKTFHWATTYFALSRRSTRLGYTCQALRCLGDILLAQGDQKNGNEYLSGRVGCLDQEIYIGVELIACRG
jgi:hypothetical protein